MRLSTVRSAAASVGSRRSAMRSAAAVRFTATARRTRHVLFRCRRVERRLMAGRRFVLVDVARFRRVLVSRHRVVVAAAGVERMLFRSRARVGRRRRVE